MHSFTAVFAASALLATASGSPLYSRDNTCGVTPTVSNTQNTQPLSQPSGIQTAADCQTQCNARSDCQSFIFGLVDNTNQCMLYSIDAASIPKQSSTNLVAYSKACSAVPSVVPTQANPTGKATGSSQQAASDQQTSSNTTPDSTGQTQQSNGKLQQRQQQTSKTPASASTKAQTCGSKPAGSTSTQPIATPSATSIDLCKAQCQANSSCKSFTFGTVNNVPACQLYSSAASAIPAPSTTAQKNAFVAYDVGCSI